MNYSNLFVLIKKAWISSPPPEMSEALLDWPKNVTEGNEFYNLIMSRLIIVIMTINAKIYFSEDVSKLGLHQRS